MGGYGIGALFFDNIMTAVMNPDNLKFNPECFAGASYGCYPPSVDENFKKMMYVLIGVFAGLVIIGIITIWQGPIK